MWPTRSPLLSYLIPVVCVASAVLIRWAMDPVLLYRAQLPLFFLAIMISGWHGGLWPSLFAVVLSLLTGMVFHPRPFDPTALGQPGEWVWIGMFIIVGGAIAVLTEELHRARRRAEASVMASQEARQMLELVLDSIPARVFWKDRNSTFLGCNRVFAHDAGFASPHEIIGKTDFDVAWKQQAELYRSDDRQVIESGIAKLGYEEPQTSPDGTQLWLRTSKIPILDFNHNIIGVLGTYEDITQWKRAQEALRESEERFRGTFDHAPVGIAHIDVRGRWLRVNQALADTLGYSREELLQKSFRDITHPEDLPKDWNQYLRLVRGEIESYSMEKRYLRNCGKVAWVHLTRALQRDSLGRPLYAISIVQDITEQKEIQEALYRSQRYLQLIMDAAPVSIAYVDVEQRIRFANRAYADRVGVPAETFVGKTAREVLGEQVYTAVQENMSQGLTGQEVSCEISAPHAELGERHLHIAYAPDHAEDGSVRGLVEVASDITERKNIEKAMAHSKQAAEEASQAKDRFLAVLSHELRTPLTPVLAAAAIMEKDARLPMDLTEEMAMIRRNVELEARLIDDLLDLTRIARGKLELKFQMVDIRKVLEHTVGICSPDIDAKELHVKLETDRDECWMRADPSRLQQIFWNLLKNSIKFTPPGGHIGIHCHASGKGQIMVDVMDSGVGIEPDILPRIFGAFEQGSRLVTREFGGLGLGLAISKALVEMHGGEITAHSEGKGKGAKFQVTLPAASPPAISPLPRPSSATCPAPTHPADGCKARILLVEDHTDTLRIMGRLLRASGFDVKTSGTVASALKLAHEEDFDLIISDLGLPDGSGLDLMRHVHRDHPHTKAIALSGYGMDEDIARSRQAGFTEHVTKPINFDHLQEVIVRTLC